MYRKMYKKKVFELKDIGVRNNSKIGGLIRRVSPRARRSDVFITAPYVSGMQRGIKCWFSRFASDIRPQ